MPAAVQVNDLHHSYGERKALQGVSFSVGEGEMFGLVGPNGGGKSTVFKVLSTLLRPDAGNVEVFGKDILKVPHEVRASLGVVFQSPALDKKLTCLENLLCQGMLYGLSGSELKKRAGVFLERLGLQDRAKEKAETLSGGLMRRLEIARALLHEPRLLILDEPTTGLDPLARREVWTYLKDLRKTQGLTVLVTTHLLEEADTCDSIGFLDEGKLVLWGTPDSLKAELGGDVISVKTANPLKVKEALEKQFSLTVRALDDEVRLERESAHEIIPELVRTLGNEIQSVTLGKPTLEDLFINKTGRRLWVPGGGA